MEGGRLNKEKKSMVIEYFEWASSNVFIYLFDVPWSPSLSFVNG